MILSEIGEVSKYIRGITFKPTDVVKAHSDDSVVCMRTKNVQKDLDAADLIAVAPKFVKREEQYLRSGDLLISSANSWNLVGKVCFISELPYKATAGGFISIVRPDDEKVDSRYFYHLLNSDRTQHYVRLCGRQTTNISNLDRSRFLKLKIPTPPITEQRRIAAILDKADGIRRDRKQAIQYTEDLLRSAFLDMFGDLNGTDWPTKTVADIAANHKGSTRTGPFGSQLLHSEFVDSGIAVLGIDNVVKNEFLWAKPRFITEEKYTKLERYRVHPGDVLVSIMGTCGRCAIVPEDCPKAINTKHLCCITLDRDKCIPEFLHSYFLLHPKSRAFLERNAKGAIMDGLNMGIIKKLPVSLPPIAVQKEFKSILLSLEKASEKINASFNEDDNLFSSLLQRAFKGDL